jgi:hypothetical protein
MSLIPEVGTARRCMCDCHIGLSSDNLGRPKAAQMIQILNRHSLHAGPTTLHVCQPCAEEWTAAEGLSFLSWVAGAE